MSPNFFVSGSFSFLLCAFPGNCCRFCLSLRTRGKLQKNCKNGEFRSDPIYANPVRNFPKVGRGFMNKQEKGRTANLWFVQSPTSGALNQPLEVPDLTDTQTQNNKPSMTSTTSAILCKLYQSVQYFVVSCMVIFSSTVQSLNVHRHGAWLAIISNVRTPANPEGPASAGARFACRR